MPKIGPVPDDVNVPRDEEKHWSILDQTKAEFAKSGRSGIVIYVEPDEPDGEYKKKLTAFLGKFNTKMEPTTKPYLVIEHETQAKELFDLVTKAGLKAELFTAAKEKP